MPRALPEPSVDSLNLTLILGALAEPGRRALMTEMYRSTEPVDCALVVERAGLGLSNPTISHHYRVLREAGLIRTVAQGRKRIVTVRRDDMETRFPGLLSAVLTGR
ncbi:ArsR/SmtB family transcription factor [Streptomyces sp. NPDC090106]|uniref:ArsR/SmtB family transcription factor n=1 Tax=Streptomyces sp. NPDC090106 TaxID=3365946 RepID=UPI00382A35F0